MVSVELASMNMDDKQNLTPELKQAYDRIMNTPAPATTTPVAQPNTTTPQAPTPQPPIPTPGPSVTPPTTTAPSTISTPATTPQPEPAQSPFLSSVPPRQVTSTGSFSFSDKKGQAPTAPTTTHQAGVVPGGASTAATNKKLSGPIVAILIAVLVVVWTLFWAKFFNIF